MTTAKGRSRAREDLGCSFLRALVFRSAWPVLVGCAACGRLEDVELPFNPAPAPQEIANPPRMVLDLRATAASDAACSLDFFATLPASAKDTLVTGAGARLKAGNGLDIACKVAPVPQTDTFVVDLHLADEQLSNFQFSATLNPAAAENQGSLSVTLAQQSLKANCTVELGSLRDGAVWIRSLDCPEPLINGENGSPCELVGGLIFEYCRL